MKLLLFLVLAAILQPSRSTELAAGGFWQEVPSQRPQVSSEELSTFTDYIDRSAKQIVRSYFCGLVEGVVILNASSVLEAAGFQLDHNLLSKLTLFTEAACADVARIPGKAAEPNHQQQNSTKDEQENSMSDISPRSELIIYGDCVVKGGSTVTAYIGRFQGFFVWSIVSLVLEEVTILRQSTEELTADHNQSKEVTILQQSTDELTADRNQSKEEDLPIFLQQSTEEPTADHNQSKEDDVPLDWFEEFRLKFENVRNFGSELRSRSGHLGRFIGSKFVDGLSLARKLADSIAGSLVSELHSAMGHLSRSERFVLYWRCLFILLEGVLRRIINELIVECVELWVESFLIEYELEI